MMTPAPDDVTQAGLRPDPAEGVHAHAAPTRSAPSERGGVQSVDRALTLLELLAGAGSDGLSLTELASRSRLNISTCHHLLATLAGWGYVAKVPGRRNYALGARVLHLGQSFMRQVDLPRRARPVLERLNEATGETVHLSVIQGDAVVTVLKIEARHAVRADAGLLGAAEPAHATATGKAMLAWLPEEQANRILSLRGMPAFSAATVTDREALTEVLRLVRRNGYALDREELQPGVVCVGAAVRDHAGAVVGAIGASAPVFRASEQHMTSMREAVIVAARALSAELGAAPAEASGGRGEKI